MWKNVYHLHKQSDSLVEVKDDESDEQNEEDSTPYVTIDSKEYQELMKDDEEDKED